MSGLFYAAFVFAVLFVIRWYVQNERGASSDAGIGFLAMRQESQIDPAMDSQNANRKGNGMAKSRRRRG